MDILKALSKNLKLADDVDLKVIAIESVGFSGADLQAVVSTAQLLSLEHLLHSEEKVIFYFISNNFKVLKFLLKSTSK